MTATTLETPAATTSPARRRTRGRGGEIVVIVVLSVLAAIGLFPYLFMIVTSFKSNDQFYDNYWGISFPLHLENYATAWQQVSPYLATSLIVAAASTVGIVILGSLSAFLLSRYQFLGRGVLYGIVALLMMIPGVTSIIPLFVLVKDVNLLDTIWVLILPTVAGGLILAIVLMRTFFDGMPQDLFDAAQLDGANGARLFFSILLPLSLPVLGTVALMTVINVWNEFFWPLLTITTDALRTVPVGLSFFRGQSATDWGPLFAGYFISSIPLLLLFLFLSKWFLAGLQGGIPGAGK
jgi:ABC-type glycerol-3-phosphate transport system permease component